MRISDWSSDVCSSDLQHVHPRASVCWCLHHHAHVAVSIRYGPYLGRDGEHVVIARLRHSVGDTGRLTIRSRRTASPPLNSGVRLQMEAQWMSLCVITLHPHSQPP